MYYVYCKRHCFLGHTINLNIQVNITKIVILLVSNRTNSTRKIIEFHKSFTYQIHAAGR